MTKHPRTGCSWSHVGLTTTNYMQPPSSKCHPVNLVGFVFISLNIGCANVVNDISVVYADRRGEDGVGKAVVAVVGIDIGVNHDGSGSVGCAVIVIVIISVVVGVVSVVDVAVKVAVVVDPGVVRNVVVIIVFAVFVVSVAGVFVVADVAIFIFFFSP